MENPVWTETSADYAFDLYSTEWSCRLLIPSKMKCVHHFDVHFIDRAVFIDTHDNAKEWQYNAIKAASMGRFQPCDKYKRVQCTHIHAQHWFSKNGNRFHSNLHSTSIQRTSLTKSQTQ